MFVKRYFLYIFSACGCLFKKTGSLPGQMLEAMMSENNYLSTENQNTIFVIL